MSTYPMLSRSVPITVADQLCRWRLARAAAHVDHAEHAGRARRELTAATVLVNSAALPEDACGMPGPVCRPAWALR